MKKNMTNAIILAAGYGMRMVPINKNLTKGILEVKGERLIDRLVRQLREAGIEDICIVTGYMSNQYDYLAKEYDVTLLYNPDFSEYNNLHSLKIAGEYIKDTFILPCDIWCEENPFIYDDDKSWYMYNDAGKMIGICHVTEEDGQKLLQNIMEMSKDSKHNDSFWEDAGEHVVNNRRIMSGDKVFEINTYEQLRLLDEKSAQLKSEVLDLIGKVCKVSTDEITNIKIMKKGMTNRSFLFTCKGKRYIMRIPGEGTDMLINRAQEAAVYDIIRDKDICDNILYIDPKNGYKITEFVENARTCDPFSVADLEKCFAVIDRFHGMELKVEHRFDIYEQIDFYEKLWNGRPSKYPNYQKVKAEVLKLKEVLKEYDIKESLTHIDANCDNFLITEDQAGGVEDIKLIDWEYAAMQDPDLDIAMFCIYAMYDKEWIDKAIHTYFGDRYTESLCRKIYCYIAMSGLLWSNWCEYKNTLGESFGEYEDKQFEYAEVFSKIVLEGA